MADEQTTVATETTPVVEENPFSKVAEMLTAQSNPLEKPVNQSFVAEPFFKEEEKLVETEVKTAEEAAKAAETTELNEDGTPKTPVVEVKPVETATKTEEKPVEVDLIGLLNTSLNDPENSISSVDQIKTLIAENKKFKEVESQYKELTQEERARLDVGREFGDFGLYDRAMSIDTTRITPKEALKQVYFFDNLDSTPGFLEKSFERDFKKAYEEDPDEEFSKDALENNGRKAINKIIEIQNDLKERGKISGGTDPEIAKKEKEEQDNKWFNSVDAVINKSDKVTYELEDEATKEKFAINIVMDAKDKQLVQGAMDRPVEFLKSLITDEKGAYDHEALFEFIVRNLYYDKALEEARKSGAAIREESILKKNKQTEIETTKAGDAGAETPIREQIANNFRQLINH